MKISLWDDSFDALRTLPCLHKLDGQAVEVWNDPVEQIDVLADRLRGTEALVRNGGLVTNTR